MDLVAHHHVVDGQPVVALRGEADLASLPHLSDALQRAIAGHPGARISVDLDGITVLDDAALGILLGAAGRARAGHGDLRLVCTSQRLLARFERTGMSRAIAIDATIADVSRPSAE